MAQWLRALAILPEDLSSGLSTHIQQFKTPVTPVAVILTFAGTCTHLVYILMTIHIHQKVH